MTVRNGTAAYDGATPDLDAAFGHWLAGFVDGEGHFGLHRASRGGRFQFVFAVELRDDDECLLRAICERVGVGALYRKPEVTSARGVRSSPRVSWRVASVPELKRLVAIFDTFPLRSRKAQVYMLWREALFAGRDTRRLEGLSRKIADSRAYDAGRPAELPEPDARLFDLAGST